MTKFDPWFVLAVTVYVLNLFGWTLYLIQKGLT